jgi:HAD superfamily hydrolase (TIGR01549 family)
MTSTGETLSNALPLSNIDAVLFDVDGTLYAQWPVRALMTLELLSLVITLRSLAKAARIWKVLASFRRVREQLRECAADADAIERLQYTATGQVVGVDAITVEQLVTEWIHRRPLKYLRLSKRTGLAQLLAHLDAQGIRSGVLSDYPADAKLRAMGLGGRFSLVLCATDGTVNAFKPNVAGFLKACQEWNLPPSRVLYVGDRPEVDAAGAEAAGMPCAIVSGSCVSNRMITGMSSGYLLTRSFRRLQRAIGRSR